MTETRRQTALITGASTGIGRALAREFALDGYDVVLVARRADVLRRVADELRALTMVKVSTIALDLAAPNGGAMLVDELTRGEARIDVVVNNAGFGLIGPVAELPLDRQLAMIQLNVTTLVELTRCLLPGMLERETGGVLNVASTAAFQPGPLMSVYYATKAFVLSFTEGLAEEVAGRDLRVSCLCPGPTATEFAERAEMTTTPLFTGAVMDVDRVAREGFAGWKAGRVVVVPGFINRRGTWVARLAPRALVRRVVKKLNTARS